LSDHDFALYLIPLLPLDGGQVSVFGQAPTTPHQARACTFEELTALVPAESRHLVRRGVLEQIFPDAHTCTPGGPDDTIVITGSIYLLGEVLERIEPGRGAGEGRLQDF